ncbi:MAG: translation elongation factor Ts [Verrucomicrobiales bacterium]
MAQITAKEVAELREKTSAGMMECKKALTECDGNIEQAVTYLRKRGIAKAEGKAGREAREGVIASYIHLQGKVGVLIEVNCETDFVAKNDQFREFVKDVTLHIAAAHPKYVSRDQVSADLIEKEKEIAAAQIKDKPPQVLEKILQGKIDKYLSAICLMEQGFIKDPETTIDQLVKQMIAKLGENIKIRRFTRYAVGEEV